MVQGGGSAQVETEREVATVGMDRGGWLGWRWRERWLAWVEVEREVATVGMDRGGWVGACNGLDREGRVEEEASQIVRMNVKGFY